MLLQFLFDCILVLLSKFTIVIWIVCPGMLTLCSHIQLALCVVLWKHELKAAATAIMALWLLPPLTCCIHSWLWCIELIKMCYFNTSLFWTRQIMCSCIKLANYMVAVTIAAADHRIISGDSCLCLWLTSYLCCVLTMNPQCVWAYFELHVALYQITSVRHRFCRAESLPIP